MLTDEEKARYDRQILFLGEEFQERLKRSSAAVVGVGGLGSPASIYLAAAGVGRIKLIDGDRVSLDNLNRQILYTPEDVGKPKALVARERLRRFNPETEVEAFPVRLERGSAKEILKDVDVVLDCTDGWGSKLMLADVCWELDKPLIHAGVSRWFGQLYVMIPRKTPHLRDVLGMPKEQEGPVPVIGVTPGVLGIMQALEAIKLLAGMETSAGSLIVVDLADLSVEKIPVK